MYRANLPEYCPGDEAFEQEAVLFRACMEHPPSEEDYRPHNESDEPKKQKLANPENCRAWGLSVFSSEADIQHAREHIMPWMKRRYIYRSEVAPTDGRLSLADDNGHRTYWPYELTDLRANAQLYLEPEGN